MGVQAGQAAGLGGGERDQVAPVFSGQKRGSGVCPRRGENLSTGVRSSLGGTSVVLAGGRGVRAGGAGGGGEERVGQPRQRDVPGPSAGRAETGGAPTRLDSRSRAPHPPPPH